MMNTDRLFESKQALKNELGSEYPTCREEISPRFLISFHKFEFYG